MKKERIMARLNGIQKGMALRPSAQLVELEKVLQQELDSILNQERDIWAQKSWVNGLVEGERHFFLPCHHACEEKAESD